MISTRQLTSGFLYIASVSVIPELLEESRSAKQALKEVGSKVTTADTSTLPWPSVCSAW